MYSSVSNLNLNPLLEKYGLDSSPMMEACKIPSFEIGLNEIALGIGLDGVQLEIKDKKAAEISKVQKFTKNENDEEVRVKKEFSGCLSKPILEKAINGVCLKSVGVKRGVNFCRSKPILENAINGFCLRSVEDKRKGYWFLKPKEKPGLASFGNAKLDVCKIRNFVNEESDEDPCSSLVSRDRVLSSIKVMRDGSSKEGLSPGVNKYGNRGGSKSDLGKGLNRAEVEVPFLSKNLKGRKSFIPVKRHSMKMRSFDTCNKVSWNLEDEIFKVMETGEAMGFDLIDKVVETNEVIVGSEFKKQRGMS
ncbi:hypothetical protein LWI28_028273 [Acer negundo]|uniref:Uncharacterized protein n=1 Tax=Acer negundo TaxID=4023 RepID=A0AAD5IRV2_ACENE|nr:hypothetical protein LWI28_028273 [Acer negundo]